MFEDAMAKLTSAQLRLEHASYFLRSFLANCGPPQDSYFHMTAYFDAFLFSLVSVEEMLEEPKRSALRNCAEFRFMKVLRNVTTHHSVLAASQSDSKFLRPFARHLANCVGAVQEASGRLALHPDRLRSILDVVEKEVPREKPNIDLARQYLQSIEAAGVTVYIEDLMQNALSAADAAVA
jgi:hypothetical protein